MRVWEGVGGRGQPEPGLAWRRTRGGGSPVGASPPTLLAGLGMGRTLTNTCEHSSRQHAEAACAREQSQRERAPRKRQWKLTPGARSQVHPPGTAPRAQPHHRARIKDSALRSQPLGLAGITQRVAADTCLVHQTRWHPDLVLSPALPGFLGIREL